MSLDRRRVPSRRAMAALAIIAAIALPLIGCTREASLADLQSLYEKAEKADDAWKYPVWYMGTGEEGHEFLYEHVLHRDRLRLPADLIKMDPQTPLTFNRSAWRPLRAQETGLPPRPWPRHDPANDPWIKGSIHLDSDGF